MPTLVYGFIWLSTLFRIGVAPFTATISAAAITTDCSLVRTTIDITLTDLLVHLTWLRRATLHRPHPNSGISCLRISATTGVAGA